jgi:hypothetical protein
MRPVLLSVDPSSSCIGWALFARAPANLVSFGRILPPAPVADKALLRMPLMAAALLEVVTSAAEGGDVVDEAVIEVSEGKVHRAAKGGGGAGMSIYGAAWGYVWAKLDARMKCHVVPANEWTRGHTKARRQGSVIAMHKRYVPEADPGMDVADAIALGDWWLVESDVRRRAR